MVLAPPVWIQLSDKSGSTYGCPDPCVALPAGWQGLGGRRPCGGKRGRAGADTELPPRRPQSAPPLKKDTRPWLVPGYQNPPTLHLDQDRRRDLRTTQLISSTDSLRRT